MDCIFCKIAAGEIPADILYQDDEVLAFRDIQPMAPVHLLVIPKKHIPSFAHMDDADTHIIGKMSQAAKKLAEQEGISESGYRIVINCGEEGGQVVPHLHMHLLGGKTLKIGLG